MEKNYQCSICGREGVKLWRPYMDTSPLVCASCAEARQSPRLYQEHTWEKNLQGPGYIGKPTGKEFPLPKWTIDASGKIPSRYGYGPEGLPIQFTDQLEVDLRDVSESYQSGETNMIPAVPDEDGYFWGYTSVPEDRCIWWKNLPNK